MLHKLIKTSVITALITGTLFAGSGASAFNFNDWNLGWNDNNLGLNYAGYNNNPNYNSWDWNNQSQPNYWRNYDWNKDINWTRQRDEISSQIRFREFNQRIGYNHEDFYKFNDWMKQHNFRDFDEYNRYSGNKFKNWDDLNQYFGNRFQNYNELRNMMRSHQFKSKDDFVIFIVIFVNFDNFNRYCYGNRFRDFDDYKKFNKTYNFKDFNEYNRYFGSRWSDYGSFNKTCGNRYKDFNDYWGSMKQRDYSDFGDFSDFMMYDR